MKLRGLRTPWLFLLATTGPCLANEDACGHPLSRGYASLIRFYQEDLSGKLGDRCRFEPSCSNYVLEATEHHGLLVSLAMTSDRLQRCHPWADDYYPSLSGGKLSDPYPSENPKGKRWKRLLCGVSSVILPGSGQAIAGRWKDGLVSLFFSAVPGVLAVWAGSEEEEALAALPGVVAAFFWSGNVLGAYRAPGTTEALGDAWETLWGEEADFAGSSDVRFFKTRTPFIEEEFSSLGHLSSKVQEFYSDSSSPEALCRLPRRFCALSWRASALDR